MNQNRAEFGYLFVSIEILDNTPEACLAHAFTQACFKSKLLHSLAERRDISLWRNEAGFAVDDLIEKTTKIGHDNWSSDSGSFRDCDAKSF